MKKKLGISFSRTNFLYYWNWFSKEDLQDDMELVELSFEKNNVEDINKCDGFVLTGGVDVHPRFYNESEVYANCPECFQPERDEFEKKIYEYSQEHKLPLLAICRGMQLVNVLHGGKLVQDLAKGNESHCKVADVDKLHQTKVEANTLLSQITSSAKNETNSAHHQAIHPNAIGDNLMANAISENDNIIEGLEFKNKNDKAFMLAVQWHPERMKEKERSPLSENIKQRFLKEIRNTK